MAVEAQWCVKFTFRDAKGQTRSIQICYQVDEGTEALNAAALAAGVSGSVTAMQALTNAHVQSEANFVSGGSAQSGFTYGTTGDYQSVATQARLYFLTTDPNGDPTPVGTLTIPAPKTEIFLADLVTVNPAQADVANLITQLNTGGATSAGAVACTKSGLLFTSFLGGVLIGKKLSRRWSKFVKDPTLTYAGI